ncbi:MAG: cold shock domain-containing protein [Arcobacteraceae bacterium]
MKGIIVYFNKIKEYGFINSYEHDEKIHFNLSDWQNSKKPTKGDKVQFQTRKTKNNTLAAQHVVIER